MKHSSIYIIILISLIAAGCSSSSRFSSHFNEESDYCETPEEFKGEVYEGKASFYANKFQGRKTASGDRFDQKKLTAAHRSLPFGTMVKVTNLSNGLSVVVRINDRGPFIRGRIIDLSRAAAKKINMIKSGVVKVRIEVL
jgi:peptidoglycan lytic transglycosylase